MNHKMQTTQAGFTLVELLVAMAIFSFMLLIVVSGFINIVHIHNQAVAANIAEDNARTAMDELVRGVRTSNGVLPSTPGTLCLTNTTNGQQILYYVDINFILKRADSRQCTVPGVNVQAITSSIVSVTNFSAVVETVGVPRPEVGMSLTVASNNGTTSGSGATVSCGPSTADKTFCSVITLNSGAVPR